VVTLPSAGSYFYACLNSGCGAGHTTMNGTMNVAAGN
jgi:hypothetical protein